MNLFISTAKLNRRAGLHAIQNRTIRFESSEGDEIGSNELKSTRSSGTTKPTKAQIQIEWTGDCEYILTLRKKMTSKKNEVLIGKDCLQNSSVESYSCIVISPEHPARENVK